jgi:hypothetical protein
VVYGGLSPELLSRISTYPELCAEAERVLESMYCASLPREVHARDLIDKELCRYYNSSKQFGKRKRPGRAMMVPPCPLNDRNSFLEFAEMCICRSGIHTHCMTCHKPPRGITGCRLCRPAGMVSSTAPVQLLDVTEDEEEEEEKKRCKKKQKIAYEVLQQKEICQPAQEKNVTQEDEANQIELPDSRLIVWEIKRPTLSGLPIPPKDVSVGVTENADEDENTVQKQWHIDKLHKAMLGIDDGNNSDDVHVYSTGLYSCYDEGNLLQRYKHCIVDSTSEYTLFFCF